MSKLIKEQAEFIKFLKRNDLYDPLESAIVMQKMFKVWKEVKQVNE